MLLDLLGLTPEKIAENESWDPKKGERTRDFGDKAGDAIMSVLTGRDYGQAVEDATKTTYTDTLRDAAGTRLTRYGSVVGGEDVSDLSKLTGKQLEQRLTSNQALKDSRTTASVTSGRDRSEYMELNDPDAIQSLAARHVRLDREKEKEKARERELELLTRSETRETERLDRADARQTALLAHQTEQTNLRNAHNANEANKTRLHELALQEARNSQTMQLAMMDREDKLADRRYAREDRAADRRQQSIMMMIKGLAQLGQGFSL